MGGGGELEVAVKTSLRSPVKAADTPLDDDLDIAFDAYLGLQYGSGSIQVWHKESDSETIHAGHGLSCLYVLPSGCALFLCSRVEFLSLRTHRPEASPNSMLAELPFSGCSCALIRLAMGIEHKSAAQVQPHPKLHLLGCFMKYRRP